MPFQRVEQQRPHLRDPPAHDHPIDIAEGDGGRDADAERLTCTFERLPRDLVAGQRVAGEVLACRAVVVLPPALVAGPAHQRGSTGDRLDAAATTASARWPVGIGDDMADVAGVATAAVDQPATEHETTTDTGRYDHAEHVRHTAPSTAPVLGDDDGHCVVVDAYGNAGIGRREPVAQREVTPGEQVDRRHHPLGPPHRAATSDTDTHHGGSASVAEHLLAHSVQPVPDCLGVILRTLHRGSPRARKDFAVWRHQSGGDLRTSDVDREHRRAWRIVRRGAGNVVGHGTASCLVLPKPHAWVDTVCMPWDIRSPEPEPDVAEVAPSRGPVPRWARTGGIAAVLLVAGVLLALRLTSSDISADVAEPEFPNGHTLELDVAVSNHGRDPVEITSTPPQHDGLVYRGVDVAGRSSGPSPLSEPLPLAPGGRTSFTLVWRVVDCGRAERAASGEATINLRVGPPIGAKEVIRLGGRTWSELVPPVCRTHRDVGLPRLVDTQVTHSGRLRLAVMVTVENAGGRALQLRAADPPVGWSESRTFHVESTAGYEVPVGDYRVFVLPLPANDCAAPVEGPAQVTLRFETVGTSRQESLRVTLANSWPNLLGVCTSTATP